MYWKFLKKNFFGLFWFICLFPRNPKICFEISIFQKKYQIVRRGPVGIFGKSLFDVFGDLLGMYLCCKYEYDTTYTCKDIYNQKLFTKIHYFRSTQKPCTGKSLRKCQKSSIFWNARAKMDSGRAKMKRWWGIEQFTSKKYFFIILVQS